MAVETTLATDIVAFAEALYTVDRAWVPDGRGGWAVRRRHPIVLQDWQKRQLREVFPPENGGRPVMRNYLDSTNKKTGKSTKAGIVAAYLAATEPNAEVVICAADKDQARDRVFRSLKFAVEHGPLGDFATAFRDRIDFSNGATVQAFAQDYKGAAGGEPVCAIFDELHAYTWEAERRLWDEMIIPPSLPYGIRWVASYAGWDGESVLLQEVWDKVTAGELQPGWPEPLQVYHGPAWWGLIAQGEEAYWLVPWGQGERGERYLAEAREAERPLSYRRLFRNEWVSPEGAFILGGQWDALIDPGYRIPEPGKDAILAVAVDLAVKHDCAAVVSVLRDSGRLSLGPWRIWKPPVALSAIEDYLRVLAQQYRVGVAVADPYQAQLLIERLRMSGVGLSEYAQTQANMTKAGNLLFSLIRERRLTIPPGADELRTHVLNATGRETERGVRLVKTTQGRKIDAAIALAMACVAAEEGLWDGRPMAVLI